MKEKRYFYEMKMGLLNVLSFVLVGIMALITYLIISLTDMTFDFTQFEYNIVLIVILPYLVIHEILHSIGYVVNGADFKRITYGMHLEKGILCCCCKQDVEKKTILWSLVYPFIFIGIITYIIGLIIGSPALVILSIFNIGGCIGDLTMFYNLVRIKDFKFFEYDNPTAFGLISKNDLSKVKTPGLKLIEEKDYKQTINKKITISKTSIIITIIYFVLCILNFII